MLSGYDRTEGGVGDYRCTVEDAWMIRQWRRLRAAVNAVDPEGLVGMGAPDNEYDCEIWQVVLARLADVTAADVKAVSDAQFAPGTTSEATAERVAEALRAVGRRGATIE